MSASRWKIILAFTVLYLGWGSAYLAVRFAVQGIPPFLLMGLNFSMAGLFLFAWTLGHGEGAPSKTSWTRALVMGALVGVGANGSFVWAAKEVPSGLCALVISSDPLWLNLLDILWNRKRPTVRIILGLGLGLSGIAFLSYSGPGQSSAVPLIRLLVLMGASLCWAISSIYSQSAPKKPSVLQSTAMSMITGAALLFIVASLRHEWNLFHPVQVPWISWLGLVDITVVGSLMGFSCYMWLLQQTTVARVSTYAFVNPIIALFLGAWVMHEPMTPRIGMSCLLLVGGVYCLLSKSAQ